MTILTPISPATALPEPTALPPQRASAHAERRGLEALLNCYLREFAWPAGEVNRQHDGDLPAALARQSHILLRIRFPDSRARLMLAVDRLSQLGRVRLAASPFVKQDGQPWQPLSGSGLVRFLLTRLARRLGQAVNQELLEQVDNSLDMTAAFLARGLPATDDGLLHAEQRLVFGHPLHPSPKSRHGVATDHLLAASPEVGACFPLYWFKAAPELWRQQGEGDARQVLAQLSGAPGLYPVHPWEVPRLLASPLIQRAIARGMLTPVGEMGLALHATASVRTLYHPELPWFIKCSIHVRLTNCVRKNAWYELESAVAMSRLLAPLADRQARHNPDFALLLEPMATGLDFATLASPAEAQEALSLGESFGLLYRRNLSPAERSHWQPEMAGSLFAWDRHGESHIAGRLRRQAQQRHHPYDHLATLWFDAYLTALLPGILDWFFHEGVVFEPHLQNTLIGFVDDLPAKVWIRDLEGTKLLPERWPGERLGGMSERARHSVWYSREQGWSRIGYCLLVNNLSEAIFHLADGSEVLEEALWARLARQLAAWQGRQGREPELAALLAGAPLPSKNNLKTRLLQKADREADYTPLPHPLARWQGVTP